MGWSFTNHTDKKSIINELTQTRHGDNKTIQLVAKKCDGNELWIVWDIIQKGKPTQRVIELCLLSREDGNWGYKGMDESMGPYYHKCPLRFLDMVPTTNEKWREGVKGYWSHKEAYKNLRAGMTVQLRDCKIPSVKLSFKQGHAWAGIDEQGQLWKIKSQFMIL